MSYARSLFKTALPLRFNHQGTAKGQRVNPTPTMGTYMHKR